jgi:hypothetical protein
MPEDILAGTDKHTGTTIAVVSCGLPWGRLEARSAHPGTALLALWEVVRRDCDERNIELIWRAVRSRTLVLRAEVLQVLRNERSEPAMADLVILEKPRGGSIPVEQLNAPRLTIKGSIGDPYKPSCFAVHLPYQELPNPEGKPYHKGKPEAGDRYTVEFKTEFASCSACGAMQVQGQPVLFVDKREVRSAWFMHYHVASYEGRPVNQNEIMEALERLDLGRSATVDRRELPVVPAEVRRLGNDDRSFLLTSGREEP